MKFFEFIDTLKKGFRRKKKKDDFKSIYDRLKKQSKKIVYKYSK